MQADIWSSDALSTLVAPMTVTLLEQGNNNNNGMDVSREAIDIGFRLRPIYSGRIS